EKAVAHGLPTVVRPERNEVHEIQQAAQISGPRELVITIGSVMGVRAAQASDDAERDRVDEVRADADPEACIPLGLDYGRHEVCLRLYSGRMNCALTLEMAGTRRP